MKHLLRYQYSLYLFCLILLTTTGIALSFSTHWSTHFSGGNSDLNQWSKYKIGSCSGQSRSVSGSQVHMSASYGTDCFGAYYRENNSTPGAFPLDSDVRVAWQWRYPKYDLYGTQAGQVTSAYGVVQYYGMSGVDTKQAGGDTRDAHVLTDGEWGRNTVDNPLWQTVDNDHNLHTSTFDFICDGRELTWWADAQQVKRITNGTPRPVGDPYRPYQFWFGNLLTGTPSDGGWTSLDLDYVYIYRVERPQMNTPAPGSGGAQPVSWNAVADTQQPDGSTWGVEYQVQACSNSNCSSPIATADWQSGVNYTFTSLPLQQTYYYRTRARWVGTPELITCWGNTVSALMAGEPDISLVKSATAQVMVGGTVQYTLILHSTGEVPASGVVVRDPIPQYVLSPANISSGGSVQGNQIVWNLGTVANGQSVTLTWQGTIDPNTPVSVSQIVNTATGNDNAGHSAQAQAPTAVLKPVMELSKAAPAQVWPGGPVVYTITVKNLGNTALTNVVVRDPLPEYVTSPTNISSSGSVQNGTIVWNLGSVPTGQTVNLTWQGTIATDIPKTQTHIVNPVTATADGGISKQAQAESEVGFPEIGVAKTGPAEAAAGSVIDYAIAVHNIGTGPAVSVVIRDPVPPYITSPTNISSGGTLENSEIVWTLSTINPGESVPVSWQGIVDPEIPLTQNNIINTTTACDSSGSCDTAMVSTRVLKPSVSLIKNATSHVYPHGDVQYELIVENSGETVLGSVVVKDPLPQYILNPRDISNDGIADPSPFEGKIEVVWTLPDMTPGQVIVLTWHGTIDPFIPDAEFAIRNVATVTTKDVAAQAEASSYVLHPRILLRKSATVMAGPGDAVLYTLTIENHSWAPAYGVEVHDPIPPYIINQRNATEGGEVRAEEILWRFGILNPGESRTLMWEGTVDPAIPATVKQIANTATAFDGMGHQDEAQAYTNLPGQTMYAYKSASYTVWPGGDIDYAVTVQNFSQATLEQVEVRDPVPEHILTPRDISHSGVFEGNTEVVWHIGSIAPGQAVVLTWRGTVDPSLPRTQATLWNQASLTSAGGLTATVRAKSYVDFPRLNLYKVSTPAQAGPGETITYTLMAENASGVRALNLMIRDLIPVQVLNPSNISDGGVVENIPVRQIVWNLASLNAGERRLLSWAGAVSPAIPAAANQITNTAVVQDLSGLNVQAQAATPVLRPGLDLHKSAPAEVIPGQDVAYTLTVSNTGQMTLRQVSIIDFVPPYLLNPTQISQGGVISGSQIIWNLGDLMPGARIDLTWQGMLDKAFPAGTDKLSNQAVASAWPGMQAVALADSAVVKPNLLVVKSAPSGIRPGEIIDYRIDVVNQGRTTIYQLQVTDPITPYLSAYQINEGGYEMPGHTITWGELGDLAPGQSRSFSWRARVDPALPREVTTLRNVAQVRGLGGLTALAEAVSPVLQSGLRLSKEAVTATHAGGEISYVLHLVNQGPGLSRQVEVRDPIPGFVQYIPGSANNYGQYGDENKALVWRFDQLQAGQAVDLTWRGQVNVDIPEGIEAIINEAYATSFDEPTPITATAVTTLLAPVLTVHETCAEFAQGGDRILYQIHLQNTGGGTLVDLTAQAPLTTSLAYVPGSATAGGQLNNSSLVWDLGTFAAGAAADLAFELQINPALTFEQVASRITFYSSSRIVGQSTCQTGITTPALRMTKLAPPAAHAGDVVEYSLVVSNTSPVVAHNTVVTDSLYPGVGYLPGTISDGGEITGSTLIWQLGDLAAGQSAMRRFKAQVYISSDFSDYDDEGKARIYNEASASADRAASVRDDVIILVPRPVLTLTRTALTGSDLGGAAVYAAVTTGESPNVLMAKVELSDQEAAAQSGAMLMAASPATISSQAEVVPAIQVLPGDTITYTLVGGNAGPGMTRQTVLREWVPAGLIVLENSISHDGYYDTDENAVVWPLGDLTEGQEVRRTYTALVPPGMRPGIVELEDNLAFISSPDAPTVYANARTEISGTFRMSGLKTATNYTQAGGKIDYAVKVQNTSPNLLDHIVIRDPLPDYTSYIAQSASLPPAFEDGGRTLVWNLGALAAGEVREVHFSVRLAGNLPDVIGRILNRASISFSGGEMFEVQAYTMLPPAQINSTPTPHASASGGSGNGSGAGPAATSVPARPSVVSLPEALTGAAPPTPGSTPLPKPGLVKSVSPLVVKAGQTTAVTWRLTFTNPTALTISGLTIRDVLPEGTIYVSSSTSRGSVTVNQVPLPQTASSSMSGTVNSTQGVSRALTILPTRVDNSIQLSAKTALTQATSLTQALQSNPTAAVPQAAAATSSQGATLTQSINPAVWTELIVSVGDVPANSRVEIVINTRVVSVSREMNYSNIATYSAANLDPGSSNEAKLVVEGTGLTILPVTGDLLDPRTPQGQITCSSVLLLLVCGVMWWQRRRSRLTQKEADG